MPLPILGVPVGLGSGILRAVKSYESIDFIDDRDGNSFQAIVKFEE